MGATSSSNDIAWEEEDPKDDVFPWFHLVNWCAENAPSKATFRILEFTSSSSWARCDLPSLQLEVSALTKDVETFTKRCPSELPENVGFTLDESASFGEWAAALLESDPSLCKVRYKLVPSKMKEEAFWSRYFAGVRQVVRRQVMNGRTPATNGLPEGL
mmetsp:Transcript_42376/g.76054  ORF Transcript_42376/g.76054 Transcript_42376/m.76054 type:complete len:159 (-) Transcript_42376:48-524(-)